jgi:transcriptional regulator with XRE-family HTH domain
MDADKLRILRITKRLSQNELARRSGVSRSYISMIENKEKEPSLAVLGRIADALGCSIKDFF